MKKILFVTTCLLIVVCSFFANASTIEDDCANLVNGYVSAQELGRDMALTELEKKKYSDEILRVSEIRKVKAECEVKETILLLRNSRISLEAAINKINPRG